MNILESIILLANDRPFHALGNHEDFWTGQTIGNEAAFIAFLKIVVFIQKGMEIDDNHHLNKICGLEFFYTTLRDNGFISEIGEDNETWNFTQQFYDLIEKVTGHLKNFETDQTA